MTVLGRALAKASYHPDSITVLFVDIALSLSPAIATVVEDTAIG